MTADDTKGIPVTVGALRAMLAEYADDEPVAFLYESRAAESEEIAGVKRATHADNGHEYPRPRVEIELG